MTLLPSRISRNRCIAEFHHSDPKRMNLDFGSWRWCQCHLCRYHGNRLGISALLLGSGTMPNTVEHPMKRVLRYARAVIDGATSNPNGLKRALTYVAATFNGIISALKEEESKLKAARMHSYVRRRGLNYQRGLAKMRAL